MGSSLPKYVAGSTKDIKKPHKSHRCDPPDPKVIADQTEHQEKSASKKEKKKKKKRDDGKDEKSSKNSKKLSRVTKTFEETNVHSKSPSKTPCVIPDVVVQPSTPATPDKSKTPSNINIDTNGSVLPGGRKSEVDRKPSKANKKPKILHENIEGLVRASPVVAVIEDSGQTTTGSQSQMEAELSRPAKKKKSKTKRQAKEKPREPPPEESPVQKTPPAAKEGVVRKVISVARSMSRSRSPSPLGGRSSRESSPAPPDRSRRSIFGVPIPGMVSGKTTPTPASPNISRIPTPTKARSDSSKSKRSSRVSSKYRQPSPTSMVTHLKTLFHFVQYAPNCLEHRKCIKMDLKCPTIVLNCLHVLYYIFMVDLKSKNLHNGSVHTRAKIHSV